MNRHLSLAILSMDPYNLGRDQLINLPAQPILGLVMRLERRCQVSTNFLTFRQQFQDLVSCHWFIG